jgi:endonuclease/exonuclease/phosphatase family metal-dependent hydrolase
MAIAFPLAFLLDTASRTWLLSYDLAWRSGSDATLTTIALVGLTLLVLWHILREGDIEDTMEEPSLSFVLPIVGLGPWLYVAMSFTLNPATLAASTGWGDEQAHLVANGLAVLGAVAAVWVTGWSALQRWYLALFGSILLVIALAMLIADLGPGWLWMGLAGLNSWAALGGILTGTARITPLRPGLWRSGLVTFLALALMLVIVILVAEYDVLWMTPVAGGILAMAALWATRVDTRRDGDALRSNIAFVGAVAAAALLTVGAWALSALPPRIVENPPSEQPLRVMTYNIHQGINADFNMDLEGIADVIAGENLDVVILNEVNRARVSNGFVDTLPLISRRLRMDYVFGANYQDGQYGNAVLSHYPILTWENTQYKHNTTEIRGVLRAVVQTFGEPITFFATHLDHLDSPDHARTEQVFEALATWDGGSRAVLLGDLNAEPNAPELGRIYDAGFVDALEAAGQGDAFTSWGGKPYRRIDYIFFTPDLSVGRAWVVPSRASDHLPVLAEIEP